MLWQIEFTKTAQKQVKELENAVQLRIKKAIKEKLIVNPVLVKYFYDKFLNLSFPSWILLVSETNLTKSSSGIQKKL